VIEKDDVRLAVIVPDEAMVVRAARMTGLFAVMGRIGDAVVDGPLEEFDREIDRAVRDLWSYPPPTACTTSSVSPSRSSVSP